MITMEEATAAAHLQAWIRRSGINFLPIHGISRSDGILEVSCHFHNHSIENILTNNLALQRNYKKHTQGDDSAESQQTNDPASNNFVALHLDIQIYEMDQHVYLVDFKCSGYETAQGRLLEEKEVTSPFPFLDMAAKLIMQLAEAD